MLAICLGVVTVGLLVEVSPERAHLRGVEGPFCLVRGLLGDHACPGCGLTRATALVLQGHCSAAAALHEGGFLVALLAVAGIIVQLDQLSRGEPRRGHRLAARLAGGALLAAVLLPWLARRL